VFFLLLVVVFIGVLWWMLVTRHVAVRIVGALLVFASAMMFGVATVNKYYNYYQTWGSAMDDLTNQGPPASTIPITATDPHTGFTAFDDHGIDLSIARQDGYTDTLLIHGRISGITRTVYVFLPPQYFWPGRWRKYHFPAIELIHGFPGQPQDWLTVLGVNTILDSLVSEHRAKPAVLVMPDANGGRGISLQCLNQAHGPQDDTYLARDLPAYIARDFPRVQKPGTGWGIAGYSEGGFCAANLGLQHGRIFSYAGVMSGYFAPSDNQLMSPPREVSAFAGDKREARLNDPTDEIQELPLGHPVPQFWLGAGSGDGDDVQAARDFAQLLETRQPSATVNLFPGQHTMPTWREMLPPMLHWMTDGLATIVSEYYSPAAKGRRALAAKEAAWKKLHPYKPYPLPTPHHHRHHAPVKRKKTTTR
jgi:enterochelin esterase-like enzyme